MLLMFPKLSLNIKHKINILLAHGIMKSLLTLFEYFQGTHYMKTHIIVIIAKPSADVVLRLTIPGDNNFCELIKSSHHQDSRQQEADIVSFIEGGEYDS